MNSLVQKFERRLSYIFAATDEQTGVGLAKIKLEAAGSGAFGNSGFAFTILNAIEASLLPSIQEALVSFDLATNRPFPPKRKLEAKIRQRIGESFDRGIAHMGDGGGAFRDPWRHVLEANHPKVRLRLCQLVDQHTTGLAPTGVKRDFRPWWEHDPLFRLIFFVSGLLLGAVVTVVTHTLTSAH